MKTVSKGVLKTKMLEYFREVEEKGEDLIVTDHGRPVLKVVPLRAKLPPGEIFADVRGRVVCHADIMEPTTDEWGET
jgi:antitoxin (DNA-binding transcriptional repressor) of toxin-antitoxin stability system